MNEQDTISLREYTERLFAERQRALDLFANNLDDRLAKLNELRAEVTRDRELFVKRDVFDQMHHAMADRIYKLETFQSRMIGMGLVLVVVVGIAGAMLAKVFGK